jgi:tetratricopeptide (TPR) repeat protein
MTEHDPIRLGRLVLFSLAAFAFALVAGTRASEAEGPPPESSALKRHCWGSEGICQTWADGYSKITLSGIIGMAGFRYFTTIEPPATVIDVPHPAKEIAGGSFVLPGDVFEELTVVPSGGKIRYVVSFTGKGIPSVSVWRRGHDLVIEATQSMTNPGYRPAARSRTISQVPESSQTRNQRELSPRTRGEKLGLSEDRARRAAQYKEEGDRYAAQERIEEAARAYLQALSLSRESFSIEERLGMAVCLSWADRLDDALAELGLIIAERPSYLPARIHRARVLAWKGKLGDAIHEADEVLRESPLAADATLVKADSLQWQGAFSRAIPLYRSVLQRQENFEARRGLAYCLLAVGDARGAEECLRALRPSNAREDREAKKLATAVNDVLRPRTEGGYTFYGDSDDNYLNRYRLLFGWSAGNILFDLGFRHTDARDSVRKARAEDLLIHAGTHLAPRLAVRGGLGFNQVNDGSSTEFLTGETTADLTLFKGTVRGSFSSEILSETAQLIVQKLRMTTLGVGLRQALTDRLSVETGYRRKFLSDGNKAHDVDVLSSYKILLDPTVRVGYRFRFLDFSRQTESGLFDPQRYVSNRFFNSLYLERGSFYLYAEYYLGHQYFERYGTPSRDFVYGGFGTAGFKPSDDITLEFNVEGGNFAAGTASGFSYVTLGPRVLVRF